MTEPTFSQLKAAARKLASNHEVVQILGSAEDNANDTVSVERAATESEWDRVALSSIACLFDSSTKPATLRWFERRGYRW